MLPEEAFVRVTALTTLTAPLNVAPPELVTVKYFREPPVPRVAVELIAAAPEFRVNPLALPELVVLNPEIAQDSSLLAESKLEVIRNGKEAIPAGVLKTTLKRWSFHPATN